MTHVTVVNFHLQGQHASNLLTDAIPCVLTSSRSNRLTPPLLNKLLLLQDLLVQLLLLRLPLLLVILRLPDIALLHLGPRSLSGCLGLQSRPGCSARLRAGVAALA